MMIKGIRLDSVTLKQGKEEKEQLTGSYSLISATDKVLAIQSFNGYNDIVVKTSLETDKARDAFLLLLQKDINSVLGLEGD